MIYRVVFTERAEKDFDEILRRLRDNSPGAVRKFSDRFEQVLKRLESNPDSFGLAFENPHFPENLRHALFGLKPKRKYRARFVVRGELVVLLSIRAPGEKPVRPEEIDS